MPLNSVRLRPGINADYTPTLNEGGYSSSNMIRWKDGLVQKLGGWVKFFAFSVGSAIQNLHAWQDLNATNHLAVGATGSLSVITGGGAETITPQIFTSDFAPNFSTVSGSPIINIVDPNISTVTTFDSVYFNTPLTVGGITVAGSYAITLVTGTTSYQITAATNATSTVSNVGTIVSFTTTTGSSTVTVNITAHTLVVGGTVNLPLDTTVGGIVIGGSYPVIAVPNANSVTITASNAATSNATVTMNGGQTEILYYINLGPSPPGTGYGLGGYGLGGYGSGILPPQQTGTPITARDWSLDNWGQTLIASPENGGIYAWDPNGGFSNAQLVSTLNAPLFSTGMFVAMPARILVAYGTTTQATASSLGVYQDPLLIRWSDQDNFTNWSIDTTNQVGSVRLPRGSAIIGAMQAPNQGLIWTDLAVWTMQYTGQPLVFGVNEVGTGCGLIAKHARCILRGTVYWMSLQNFYTMGGGGPTILPCSVWDVVFQDLDTVNSYKCWAWANSLFSEVWFFYPSIRDGAGICTRYVKVNVGENPPAWDYGVMSRSAGIDQTVLGSSISGTSTGLVYQHDQTNDGDGAPINAYVESGYFMISDGTFAAFVDQWFPDMKWGFFDAAQTASVQVTFTVLNDDSGTTVVKGPYTMTQATNYITTRFRGHRVKIRIESNDLGTWWRLGRNRYRVAQDGKR
jgi:hypothetical protein